MAAEYFAQRREIGIFNIGGSGKVKADDQELVVDHKDAVYVGSGTREIVISSTDPARPAYFYFVSYPAHASYPTSHKTREVFFARLGSQKEANLRTIKWLPLMAAGWEGDSGAGSTQVILSLKNFFFPAITITMVVSFIPRC
ncbi:MAG: hypothetical protein M1469_05010 [Bacteroidetes bacterium]|nr:hypothetical protein [Bacteroidota bacterium]